MSEDVEEPTYEQLEKMYLQVVKDRAVLYENRRLEERNRETIDRLIKLLERCTSCG